MWLAVAAFTSFCPASRRPKSAEHLTLRQRLGLDALSLLKNHDHRVVFITAALFAFRWRRFIPYTPPHLRNSVCEHTSAWMTLGQVTEIIAMFGLGRAAD